MRIRELLQNIQQLKINLLTSAKSFVALFFHGANMGQTYLSFIFVYLIESFRSTAT